jgi:hypothetical protein
MVLELGDRRLAQRLAGVSRWIVGLNAEKPPPLLRAAG